MESDGPFGRQITGGASLGEALDERFYIEDDLNYYGGEDSFTCMAPLYGLYGFDYLPWVNLHRYARSLFITNYDPEYQSMRELHYGMNPSATGNTLRLGGSVTRGEMRKSLDILFLPAGRVGLAVLVAARGEQAPVPAPVQPGTGQLDSAILRTVARLAHGRGRRTLTIRPQGLNRRLQGECECASAASLRHRMAGVRVRRDRRVCEI